MVKLELTVNESMIPPLNTVNVFIVRSLTIVNPEILTFPPTSAEPLILILLTFRSFNTSIPSTVKISPSLNLLA